MKYLSIILITIMFASCGQNSSSDQANSSNTGLGSKRKMDFESDEEFLTYIQKAHFDYMWDGAEPNSGLSPERIHMDGVYPQNDKAVITTGGSGFGITSLIVGMERGFITRKQGTDRMETILNFLEKTERFHGIWSHWINGETAKVQGFSKKDNGGDIVESAFLMEGLLCMRQYLANGNDEEKSIAQRIDKLWREMEWDWYLNGQDVLFWHWSTEYGWEMNHKITGYNECLMAYILAASSPTHPIPASAYHNGWAREGKIANTETAYELPLIFVHNGAPNGGPLFWAHYSYIGLDPRGLSDDYGNYWEANKNQSLINQRYCIDNPNGYTCYSDSCWGLTASYSVTGYRAHAPLAKEDVGVITPTAALSSFPYCPEESMKALKYFYYNLGDKLWGKYGFYDAFSVDENWFPRRYLAIDQNTICPMIENHRTGLIWELFMSCPEIQEGLNKLGFRKS